ncbi:hypothetical protein [Fuerstiella marisgermanici]|uniref:Uncharacterized protein n=1 Tax=Fuerstiella marisgermanici TaxID=1891926 RepID=A0A1P8WDR0_9PLAN|nr:hypothetical protein [Fuerstiella marisgermanici]APZ92218.1 hypothetical protein Fuma_01827 [Fuerstiella marisgermanici]
MAKKVNKTQLIKEELTKNPDASPIDVAAKLKSHKVTPQYVSSVKYHMIHKDDAPKTKKRGASAKKKVRKPNRADISLSDLVAAKEFAESVGGVDTAKAVLDALSKLS